MVSTNMVSNCPISVASISNAHKIYGLSMTIIKVNSTRNNPRPVINYEINIPIKIYKNNSNVELCIDVVYINGVSFLVSIDRQVKYRSIFHIPSQNEEYFSKVLTKYFESIIQKYSRSLSFIQKMNLNR